MLVRCYNCFTKRWFEPADLIKLMGDLDTDELDGKMVCVKCGTNSTRGETRSLTARERQTIRVRRLKEIKMVRRVIWTDGE